MLSRNLFGLLVCLVLICPALAGELDREKYIGVDELKPGMTGTGKTVLKGTELVEFRAELLAIIHNFAPKQDVLIVRLSGANLENTGVIGGMSGSPVYFDGRLAGAVAFSWWFAKEPICGVQPIEQMLSISDEHPWKESGKSEPLGKVASRKILPPALMAAAKKPPADKDLSLAAAPGKAPDIKSGLCGEDIKTLQPIRTPVAVSGATPKAMKLLRQHLVPRGLLPVQAGGAGKKAAAGDVGKFEPGSLLCVSLMTGDMDLTASGTVTEVAGDKIYGFGHSFFGMGEADYPISVGEALFVFPSQLASFREGAPVKEVGRLTWDEMTGVVGRVGPERARMVPVEVEILGPDEKARRLYRYNIVHHRLLSGLLVGIAAINSVYAKSELPQEVTLKYTIAVEPEGKDPVVLNNIATGQWSAYWMVFELWDVADILMNNVFEPMRLKSVKASIEVIPRTHSARIRSVRAMKNAVRPGQAMPIEIILQTYQGPEQRLIESVPIPADTRDGTYRLTVCDANESLWEEMREMPGRYDPRTVEDMLWIMRRQEPQDHLFFRLHLPKGDGLAVEGDELPNLPDSMRSVLGQAGRDVSQIKQPRITRRPMGMVINGSKDVMIRVDEDAPKE